MALVCAAASGSVAREVVGAADVSGKELDLGVQQGKKYLAVGLLYGGSPIGVDFEYAFNRAVGGRVGLGLGGVEAGLNFHLTSDMRKDLFFAATVAYLPALDHLTTPILGFGMRWYWGPNARTGVGVEIGSGYNFVDRSPEFFDGELDVAKHTVLPRIALGVVFKLR
jgi:hypothetical protein